MSGQVNRLEAGGLIDRSRPLEFSFDGRAYTGYAGDTLASALLANDVRLLGRSFKYHRPRGIFGAGSEEPNALVQLRSGSRHEPNLRATQVELYPGLEARSQNRWPSLAFDVGAVNNLVSRFLPAGFYYKTFMWPPSWWMRYEQGIRRAAGLGDPALEADPDRYDKRYAHCDVLVVGAGASGLAAAKSAARGGSRVFLADEHPRLGGGLLGERARIDGAPALDWVASVEAELEDRDNVRLLRRSSVFGYYDHNLIAIAERRADHLPVPGPKQSRQRLWLVRAQRVVLATGAIERPLVFAANDLPGVMLASAARSYVNQFAVRPGRRAVVFTNNDSAYTAAADLRDGGVDVALVLDSRPEGPAASQRRLLEEAGIECLTGHAVTKALGRGGVHGVEYGPLQNGDGTVAGMLHRAECDLLCVSGGWNPTVHLFSQSRGSLRYDPKRGAFLPASSPQAVSAAGAVAGAERLSECIASGLEQGAAAGGVAAGERAKVPDCEPDTEAATKPLWSVSVASAGKRFVDLQNDVTAEDIALAVRESYRSVEHLKRYTTLGMGTDQGRTSNVNGLAILAGLRGDEIPKVGTTTFRPPYTPVTLGTLAGREVGADFAPVRYTPMHSFHEAAGASFTTAGQWLRPECYRRPGESFIDAVNREAKAVREGVGLVDVSTLGKIDLQGRDVAAFLERVYCNRWANLKVGRCRYGIMLREDGFAFDDGTTTRIGEHRFYLTTTTARAAQVMSHLEYYAQVVWPEMEVFMTSVSDQWASMALAGPRSRDVLSRVVEGCDASNDGLPHLGYAEGTVVGAPVRLFRMTFSGELAYEIHTPADYGLAVWQALLDAGKDLAIVPYGTEAMTVLRIEKGHVVVGAEIDGRTTVEDLGFGRMLRQEGDYVGKRSLERPAFRDPNRPKLVGLVPSDGQTRIPRGAQIVADPSPSPPVPMLGHVSSQTYSPNLETPIALALVQAPYAELGRELYAASPLQEQTVKVVVSHPVFIDPEGHRPRG